MHELSLMENLLSIVARAAEQGGGEPVRAIHCRIGELAGVNVESLQFAFEVLSGNPPAAGARFDVERVPIEARCRDCGAAVSSADLVFRCAECGSGSVDIVAGREMEIDYILVGDEEAGGGSCGEGRSCGAGRSSAGGS